jgi:hypothetical protein
MSHQGLFFNFILPRQCTRCVCIYMPVFNLLSIIIEGLTELSSVFECVKWRKKSVQGTENRDNSSYMSISITQSGLGCKSCFALEIGFMVYCATPHKNNSIHNYKYCTTRGGESSPVCSQLLINMPQLYCIQSILLFYKCVRW